jgi:hypothetical protein
LGATFIKYKEFNKYRKGIKMIYCKFEWTWEKLRAREINHLSKTSKRIYKTKTFLRYCEEIIILLGGLYLIFSENLTAKIIGFIFIGFVVLYFIYYIFLE